VLDVVEPDQLMARAMELASRFATLPPKALRFA
jgi:enoyl-CoA hydratase/carnithine racemase